MQNIFNLIFNLHEQQILAIGSSYYIFKRTVRYYFIALVDFTQCLDTIKNKVYVLITIMFILWGYSKK